MPRYLIERRFDAVTDEEMQELTRSSKRLLIEQYPEVTWEHSHVVVDGDGAVTSFCVYEAPSEEAVRAHGDALGSHLITNLYEIAGELTPAEIELER